MGASFDTIILVIGSVIGGKSSSNEVCDNHISPPSVFALIIITLAAFNSRTKRDGKSVKDSSTKNIGDHKEDISLNIKLNYNPQRKEYEPIILRVESNANLTEQNGTLPLIQIKTSQV